MKYVIVRPTNNYGIGQYVEKLIPKSIKYLGLNRKIDLHDKGEPHRTWLHATDTAKAVFTIIESKKINEIYNISGNIEFANKEIIKKILFYYFSENKDDCWTDYITDSKREGQDIRYSIDDSKLRSLGWKAEAAFDKSLEDIVQYYKNNFIW
jgi:dTDP-glucose 4,6-dehydratase